MATKISTVRGLYKFLLKETTKLPDDAAKFYKTQIRAVSLFLHNWVDFRETFINFEYQGFYQHAEEDDPQRIEAIISRAVEDADWIVKKVITKEISLYKFQ